MGNGPSKSSAEAPAFKMFANQVTLRRVKTLILLQTSSR